jgi:hypothetical protein
MTILLLFYVLTAPYDKSICTLWVSMPPSAMQVEEACGSVDLSTMNIKARLIDTGQIVTRTPAANIYTIMSYLPIDYNMGDYLLELYIPDYVRLVCAIETANYQPTTDELIASCGDDIIEQWADGSVTLEYIASYSQDAIPLVCAPPAPVIGLGIYDTPEVYDLLATDAGYTWLAGRLIWWGLADADCIGGYSGINENGASTPCGLHGARSEVTLWQNKFDRSIWEAAVQYNIPAVLLKRLIGLESQFWPLWQPVTGETSIMQITYDGLDTVLRFDPELGDIYCHRTMWCQDGYAMLSEANRQRVVVVLYNDLTCYLCGPGPASDKTEENITLFARIMRAYYCYAVAITDETNTAIIWPLALAAYHAGGECIVSGQICPAGLDYIRRVERE